MWGVDDEFRSIIKEERILFSMALDTLLENEWLKFSEERDEIGYS